MKTEIRCPQCGTPHLAEIHQVIDAGRNPEMKQLLLSGQLNVTVCPNCGTAAQMGSTLLYHDPDHELMMVYVPPELNLNQMQREEWIGRLAREVLDNAPPEQRKAYMLQPQTILSMQTLLEKVLETEGVTPEMIARQRKQAELLNTLAGADTDVADILIEQRADEIDETFFAMLRSYVDAAYQADDNMRLIPLLNLQARLMTETVVGRRLEKQRIALHGFNQAAKKQGGLSPALLLEYILKYENDRQIVEQLALAGQQAMTYEFFTLLTQEIEQRDRGGSRASAAKLTKLRTDLLDMQEAMRVESEKLMQGAMQTLDTILQAEDRQAAIQQNLQQLDEVFMYYLSARLAQAEQQRRRDEVASLRQVQDLIVEQLEGQTPPEIQFLNALLDTESTADRQQLIDNNQDLKLTDMVELIDALQGRVQDSNQPELAARLEQVRSQVAQSI